MFMRQTKCGLVLALFLSVSMAGCLSSTQGVSNIELSVEFEVNNGTLVESYSNGELTSTENVVLEFDFSQTTASGELVTFGIDARDGRSPVTIDAQTESVLSIEFTNHGIYSLDAYAVDNQNNRENTTIVVRIELRMEWVESNTNNPTTLIFDPNPANGGMNPTMIEIYSVVENPSLLEDLGTGGQSVEFTWDVADEQNDVCQSKTEQVENGDSVHWHTLHFNTFQIHELRISYDDGQDSIRINQSVSLLYSEE